MCWWVASAASETGLWFVIREWLCQGLHGVLPSALSMDVLDLALLCCGAAVS